MMKKYLLFCVGLSYLLPGFSDICPTVEAIQHNELSGWQVFDSDNGEPLPAEQFAFYQKELDHFAEADYFQGAEEGPAQCYYASHHDPYYGNAYLAKQGLQPDFQKTTWHEDGAYHAVCNAEHLVDCVFVSEQLG